MNKMNSRQVVDRALVVVVAAGLLFIAPGIGALRADPAHHPGADAKAAPAAPAMAPGASSGTAPIPPSPPAMAPSEPMSAPALSPGAPAMAGGEMGGMMGKMGDMMGGSGASRNPIYSTLMTLPALTPERRAEIDALANQQIMEGMERHAKGAETLESATQAGEYAAMQRAVGMMREGLDQLGAGIAARRVLAEGKAPRNLALDWFKREMSLASPIPGNEPTTFLGVTPIHFLTMVLLVAFVLAMVAMYFFKMRRTAALFGRIEGGSGNPPPGSSPPLAGTPAASMANAPPP